MENKKQLFNRSEYMKNKYAERRKKVESQSDSQQNVESVKLTKQIEKKDRVIKAQMLKQKRKEYSAKAYQKRKQMLEEFKKSKNNPVISKNSNNNIKKIDSDSKSLIFKINNSEQKEITIRIDV